MSSPVTTSAAASTAVADLLTGGSTTSSTTSSTPTASTTLTVTCTGRFAAYLVADDDRLLAVVSRDAVVPPCALVLAAGARPDVLLPAGTQVTAGNGTLRWRTDTERQITERQVTVTRWWSPDSVLPAPVRAPAAGTTGDGPRAAGPRTRAAREHLRDRLALLAATTDPLSLRARAAGPAAARAVVDRDVAGAADLLGSVIGLGPGLTPSGDDVATGVVLMLLATAGPAGADPDDVRHLGNLLTAVARRRTTTVSAALLAHACQGLAAGPVADAARLLAGTDAVAARTAHVLDRLLAVGHHSGADLASGMLAVADALSDTVPTPVPTPVAAGRTLLADHPRPTTFRRSA